MSKEYKPTKAEAPVKSNQKFLVRLFSSKNFRLGLRKTSKKAKASIMKAIKASNQKIHCSNKKTIRNLTESKILFKKIYYKPTPKTIILWFSISSVDNSTKIFLAFEGIDGAGKTTQINLLEKWLKQQGLIPLVTREPGGTNVGKKIRKIVLDSKEVSESAQIDPKTETLLYAADRAQHVQETILPALQAGKIVISDRYVDSSIAYQSAGRKIDETIINILSNWATNSLKPNLTIVLDLSVAEAKRRLFLRGETADRMENEQQVFHQFVKEKFLELAKNNSEEYYVVDGSLAVETIAKNIQKKISPLLKNLQSFKQI